MKLGSKFFNYHSPIEDLLELDITIDQVLVVCVDMEMGAPE
jgi:hypothetical protein